MEQNFLHRVLITEAQTHHEIPLLHHRPCSELLDRCYPKPFSFSHGSFSRRSPWDGPSGPHTDPLMLGVVGVAASWVVVPWTGCVSSTCLISENTFSWWFCKRLVKVCLRPVCFLKWAIFLLCCLPPNLLSFYSFCKFLQHCNQKCKITKSTYAGLKIERASNSC